MEDVRHEQERKFIHEKIVPKKRVKKIIFTVLSVVVLAALFGATAGVVYSLTRNLLGEGEGNRPQTIIIARPEATEEESKSTEPSGNENESESVPSSEDLPAPVIETRVMYDGMSERMKSVSTAVSRGLVLISTTTSGGVDWLDRERVERQDAFGVLIAESIDRYFVLADSASIPDGTTISAYVSQQTVPGKLIGRDAITGICIISLEKSDFKNAPDVISLGSSASLVQADEVFLVGMAGGRFGSLDCGLITYESFNLSVTDGYQHLIYTNVGTAADSAAALFNGKAELVGWVSANGTRTGAGNAVAAGISPLKYLIEDLCSEAGTAYLGVVCTQISADEAAQYDIPAGYYVQEVIADSPAYTAGIQPGDQIISINGSTVSSNRILQHIMDELRPGDNIIIELERKGTDGYGRMEATVRLTAR